MHWIVTTHLAVTWMLVGLIWVVQILVYPQFLHVAAADFKDYHQAHCFRISLIVGPLLFLEAGSAAWLIYEGKRTVPFLVSVGLVGVIWLSTAMLQAPAHTRLMRGLDAALVRHVIRTNWIRTLAWTARGFLVSMALP